MGRSWVLLLACAVVAPAGEPDGAVAGAFRWTGPGGSASRARQSLARPVYTEVEEAWRIEFDVVLAPPVHWHGTGFVVVESKGDVELVAFDLLEGTVADRKTLPKRFNPAAGLQVWDFTVFLMTGEGSLNAYRFDDGRFRSPWTYRGRMVRGKRMAPQLPVVHDNELYCLVGTELWRLRPGSRLPVWKQTRAYSVARPVIYDRWIFLLGDAMRLEAFRRSDGARAGSKAVGYVKGRVRRVDMAVARDWIYVWSEEPFDTTGGAMPYARVPFVVNEQGVRYPGEVNFARHRVGPVRHRLGTLVQSRTQETERTPADLWEWRLMVDERKYYPLAISSLQPDLFRDGVAPVVLGDVVYFGRWASDLETREILWRLPIDEITFPVVPADRMILVVERRTTLRAYRGRGRR